MMSQFLVPGGPETHLFPCPSCHLRFYCSLDAVLFILFLSILPGNSLFLLSSLGFSYLNCSSPNYYNCTGAKLTFKELYQAST